MIQLKDIMYYYLSSVLIIINTFQLNKDKYAYVMSVINNALFSG